MWLDLGRWDTVDDMLAALDPMDLVKARAAYETVPLHDGWRQAGTIAAALHNAIQMLMAAQAGERRVDPQRLCSPQDYIPKIRFKKVSEVQVNQESIDTYQKMIEGQYRR